MWSLFRTLAADIGACSSVKYMEFERRILEVQHLMMGQRFTDTSCILHFLYNDICWASSIRTRDLSCCLTRNSRGRCIPSAHLLSPPSGLRDFTSTPQFASPLLGSSQQSFYTTQTTHSKCLLWMSPSHGPYPSTLLSSWRTWKHISAHYRW